MSPAFPEVGDPRRRDVITTHQLTASQPALMMIDDDPWSSIMCSSDTV
jgi:hypothetical protein